MASSEVHLRTKSSSFGVDEKLDLAGAFLQDHASNVVIVKAKPLWNMQQSAQISRQEYSLSDSTSAFAEIPHRSAT
jgi:hypothetical protein